MIYLSESAQFTGSYAFEDRLDFIKEFMFLRKWAMNLLELYPECLASKESFLLMIKEFMKSGKWGLYLPLAKL